MLQACRSVSASDARRLPPSNGARPASYLYSARVERLRLAMYTRILIAASVLLVSAGLALAQTFPLTPEPRSGVAGPPYARAPTSPAARSDPSGVNVANPSANPAPPPRGIRNPYFGEDNPYVTGTATPRRGKAAGSPAETSAQRQSGLSDADARSLLQQQGCRGNRCRADSVAHFSWRPPAP